MAVTQVASTSTLAQPEFANVATSALAQGHSLPQMLLAACQPLHSSLSMVMTNL